MQVDCMEDKTDTVALVIKDNLLHHRSKPVLMKNNLPRFLKSIMEDVVTNADKSISIPEKRKKMSEWQNCFFIHWLPDRWKRWYRINFAMLPADGSHRGRGRLRALPVRHRGLAAVYLLPVLMVGDLLLAYRQVQDYGLFLVFNR